MKREQKTNSILTKAGREAGVLTVVVPAYCEEETVALTAETLATLLTSEGISHEILFVDDGSEDGTWAAISRAGEAFAQVRGIRFSRNFGKESAIFAGLAQSRGDCVVVMDCDLQHPPEKIPEMYQLWREGYQVVAGVKESRGKENPLHTFAARTFYHFISSATGLDMGETSDFKLLDRRAVDALLAMGEKNAFFRALSAWIGFSTAEVSFQVQERVAGQSKWSLSALIGYAITNLASFSTAPLRLITYLGGLTFLLSLVFGGMALWQKFQGVALEGFTTVILLQLLIGSVLMISLGIIGYYISKIYEEMKDRPRFIIEHSLEHSLDKGQEDWGKPPGKEDNNGADQKNP